MKHFIFYTLILLFVINQSVLSQETSETKDFINNPNLAHAAISFEIADVSSGKIIASYNKDMVVTPASVMKLVTTSIASQILGSNYTYKTPLFHDGMIDGSILYGNLYIEGSGDPTLGTTFIGKDSLAFLKDFLSGVEQAGIKEIKGEIIALDQLFGYKGISQKWLVEDIGNAYATGIYGISIFDNRYSLRLQSGVAGTPVKVLEIIPPIEGLSVRSEALSSTAKSDNSSIFGIPFSNERILSGTIPQNRNSFLTRGDIPDPGLFMAQTLKSFFEANNIFIEGEATTYRLLPLEPIEQEILATVSSPKLSEILRVINFRSNNHYADHVYHLLTDVKNINPNTYWKGKGLDSSALFMYDGSGISPINAISASFLTDLLVYMYKQEGQTGVFYKSLPCAGKEGTVRGFLKGTALEGRARIKSGSMSAVQSYAGYIEKADGKVYAFSLIVNNFTGSRSELRKAMERLLLSF